MFGKKTAASAVRASAPPSDAAAAALPINPYVGASAAAVLFLGAAVSLIAVAGDPRAGVPSVRIALSGQDAPTAPPGWREALTPDKPGDAPVTTDTLELFNTPLDAGAPPGEAIITLPGAAPAAGMGAAANPQALPPAPAAGLTEPGPGGPLPIIASDGRTAAQVYARPFRSNGKPKVAIVVGGLGLKAATTRQAIEQLPPEITLSFVPSADGLQGWIDLARANGHEVLLEAPMEPLDYPESDPGPYTLMANAAPQETIKKLEWLLTRATGYFGVTNYLGSRFVASDQGMAAFSTGLRQRGLAFVDDGSAVRRGGGVPRASADAIIDDQLDAAAIDKRLLSLEAAALQHGQAMGSAFAWPLTLSQVSAWAAGLQQRGYQLAPASALMIKR